jgi:hypothetical protein
MMAKTEAILTSVRKLLTSGGRTPVLRTAVDDRAISVDDRAISVDDCAITADDRASCSHLSSSLVSMGV